MLRIMNINEQIEQSHKYSAVGIHVFAGGFSGGVMHEANVIGQLEAHNFGLETAEKVWGIPCTNSDPKDWPDINADWAYGNPRCTGFSCVTAGYDSSTHGPFSNQCQDIHDLVQYAKEKYKVIVWESVQQAFTVGRPLLDLLRDEMANHGYRTCHLLMCGHMFGNPQCRKRYFCVFYDKSLKFNVSLPDISHYTPTVYDAIWDLRHNEVKPYKMNSLEYDFNSYVKLGPHELEDIPRLPTGWSTNLQARYDYPNCSQKTREIWRNRTSDMPFSMHCPYRMSWFRQCPTLTSTSVRLIHPWHHRPVTVGELSTFMGWEGRIPIGKYPCAQLAKGVIPAAARWLAQQVHLCLDDNWGGEDWEVKFDRHEGEFKGHDASGQLEKTIDLTYYYGHQFDVTRFDPESRKQFHRFNIDPMTGRLLRNWNDIHDYSDV